MSFALKVCYATGAFCILSAMHTLFLLYEHASGYALFSTKQFEDVGKFLPQVEGSILDFGKFSTLVQLYAYEKFTDAAEALNNCNAISEGLMHKDLLNFLANSLPGGSESREKLGVGDPRLGQAICEQFPNVKCLQTDAVPEILRGIRYHFTSYLKKMSQQNEFITQLGLAHSFSRGKVQFNVNRVDNMIIQAVGLIDQLEKDCNKFVMRIREWYSCHFPELIKIVPDQYAYCRCVKYIEIVGDEEKAVEILNASRSSMGMEISAMDLMNINHFCDCVINMLDYRKQMQNYLNDRMECCAPNLAVVVGDQAGSLSNLAKYPASTIQILGAEKALFRALKKKGNTPKYGLLFHSPFISRASSKNKGKISRFLANKCAIASRLDYFSDIPVNTFGNYLKSQIEERLKLFDSGEIPRKNIEVMHEAVSEAKLQEQDSISMENDFLEDANFEKIDVSVGYLCYKFFNGLIPTRERTFYCEDASISKPFMENTVSVKMLLCVSIGLPLMLCLLHELVAFSKLENADRLQWRMISSEGLRKVCINFTRIVVKYLFGFLLTIVLMLVGKSWFGVLRPHFLAVCKPGIDWHRCEGVALSLQNCTQTDMHALLSARHSFPSGHASAAIYSVTFLLFYLLSLRTRKSVNLNNFDRISLSLYALWCVFVCVSRVTDCWHHVTDVVGGSAMGFAVAWLIFNRYEISTFAN
ncbi:snoRNA binding domain protein [Trichinella nativa]|uniref:Nucleolar protein 56 n=1 Tax=Trichinella nativa TaxID=6335 RepID=A0A1Y3EUS1_9BILA|nr:snoRNA binding domain protein [Trichinella nativa]